MTTPANVRVGFVQWGGTSFLAELYDDGRWRASLEGRDRPALAALVQSLYDAEPSAPELGDRRVRFLKAFAKTVGGTAAVEGGMTSAGQVC